jgi:glucose/arabinose dehydrogenase
MPSITSGDRLCRTTASPSGLQTFRKATRLVLFTSLTLLVMAGLLSSVHAATLPTNFSESQIAGGLTNPTAMAFAPDGRLFVCQQGGQLRVIKNGALLPTPFVTLTVDSTGERGLLGVAFDPDFATNQFVPGICVDGVLRLSAARSG